MFVTMKIVSSIENRKIKLPRIEPAVGYAKAKLCLSWFNMVLVA
jgi:hypothetical protein